MLKKIFYNFLKVYGNSNEGTTAVEFALISIPFLMMIFGIMESGRLVWAMNGVQFAVEETSRYASLNPGIPTTALQIYAEDKLEEMFISSDELVVISSAITSSGVAFVEVGATYDHTTILSGFLPAGYGNMGFGATSRKPIIN